MKNDFVFEELYKITVIVSYGKGSKVLSIAKESGLNGGTVLLAKGTYYNKFMTIFGLNDSRKEMVIIVARKKHLEKTVKNLRERLKLDKKDKGILYIQKVENLVGIKKTLYKDKGEKIKEAPMYKAIYTIVDRGKGEDVVVAASKAGAKGGTILNARGSGTAETAKIFAIEIEPEKELVVILAKTKNSEEIITSIRNELQIDKIGKGIIYTQNIEEVIGLIEE